MDAASATAWPAAFVRSIAVSVIDPEPFRLVAADCALLRVALLGLARFPLEPRLCPVERFAVRELVDFAWEPLRLVELLLFELRLVELLLLDFVDFLVELGHFSLL